MIKVDHTELKTTRACGWIEYRTTNTLLIGRRLVDGTDTMAVTIAVARIGIIASVQITYDCTRTLLDAINVTRVFSALVGSEAVKSVKYFFHICVVAVTTKVFRCCLR
jgi:hypothetical protein